jgi:5-methylcytosine-specific restriction endonuclease McrBC regulatory subunit McrC
LPKIGGIQHGLTRIDMLPKHVQRSQIVLVMVVHMHLKENMQELFLMYNILKVIRHYIPKMDCQIVLIM